MKKLITAAVIAAFFSLPVMAQQDTTISKSEKKENKAVKKSSKAVKKEDKMYKKEAEGKPNEAAKKEEKMYKKMDKADKKLQKPIRQNTNPLLPHGFTESGDPIRLLSLHAFEMTERTFFVSDFAARAAP